MREEGREVKVEERRAMSRAGREAREGSPLLSHTTSPRLLNTTPLLTHTHTCPSQDLENIAKKRLDSKGKPPEEKQKRTGVGQVWGKSGKV